MAWKFGIIITINFRSYYQIFRYYNCFKDLNNLVSVACILNSLSYKNWNSWEGPTISIFILKILPTTLGKENMEIMKVDKECPKIEQYLKNKISIFLFLQNSSPNWPTQRSNKTTFEGRAQWRVPLIPVYGGRPGLGIAWVGVRDPPGAT